MDRDPQAGETLKIKAGTVDPVQGMVIPGALYRVEGLWKEVSGGRSWMACDGNLACMHYAMRSASNNLPIDDNVYYGHISGLGHLVHESELEELASSQPCVRRRDDTGWIYHAPGCEHR